MRLRGIARRVGLERTIVSNKAGPLGKIERLEPFDLELEDGSSVRVELAKQVRIEPVEVRDARWGDLEDEPAFASLRASGPGPHVHVTVRRAAVEEGARVELLAEDAEHVFDAVGGGHRAAPGRKLVSVRARAIASGPDAAAIVERMLEKKPAQEKRGAAYPEKARPSKLAPKTKRTWLFFLAASLPFFAGAAAIKLTPFTVDLGIVGLTLVVAAFMGRVLSQLPRFVSDGRLTGKGELDPGRLPYFTIIGPLTFAGMSLLMDCGGPWHPPDYPKELVYNASAFGLGAFFLWGIGMGALALAGRNDARLFRILLGAPPLPAMGKLARTWGSFEGVVRDPTPVTAEGEAVAIVHVIDEEVKPGSDPNIYTERVLSKGTFFVDAPDAPDAPDGTERSIEVHPDGAVWTSTVSLSVVRKAKGGGPTVVGYLRAVPLRGNILVAGRVDRDERSSLGRVVSGGQESLIFAAVREGENVRARLHAVLLRRRVALLLALAAIAAAIAIALYVEPMLPPFHMPGSGD